jgi:hypothetical protein
MHHEEGSFALMQGLPSEPMSQVRAVVGAQDILNGILGAECHNALGCGQQK